MKVAVLSPVAWRTPPVHYGPWEQVASTLTEGLVKEGIDVTLFATTNSMTRAKLDAVIPRGYDETGGIDAKVSECLHISNLMERAADFDIIHNHFDFLPLTYSRLISAPMITTIHGFSSPLIIPVYKKYNSTSNYISISLSDRSPELNYLANIYHGLTLQDFTFIGEPGDYLLYFGRIHPDKGTAEAIDIAIQSKRRLVIAGIVQDEKYFNEKVQPYLNDQISFIGPADAVKRNQLLGNAFALLHPIHFKEPFGLSVVEAMFCGTPVIAFKKGSMQELIQHERTGFLVNTVKEAVEAVEQVHKIDRRECYRHATSKFSSEKMVKDYISVYKRIISQ
jgi:glycosyltransferase involved in cell wall biosynthesis